MGTNSKLVPVEESSDAKAVLEHYCDRIKPSFVYYKIVMIYNKDWSRDKPVGIATGYGMDDLGSSIGRDNKFFSFSHRRYRLCVPLGLLSSGHWRIFPGGKAVEEWSWLITSI
jgi:hypothetical protein